MGQLHELIATEVDVKATAEKILVEGQALFANKKDHFQGSSKTYAPFTEGDRDIPESTIKPIVTTVDEKLAYIRPYLVKEMDVILQKEKTNCIAKADVILDGGEGFETSSIAKDVPVTVLVQYEKRLVRLRGILDNIPTLDPAFDWETDTTKAGVWKTKPVIRVRTKKIAKPIILHEATKEHPAQVQLVSDDIPVGNWTEVLSSGAYTPIRKSQLLARVDALIEAVKKARAKANKAETVNDKVGAALLKFVFSN